MNVTAALLICVLAVSSMYLVSGVNVETGTCTYTVTRSRTTHYTTQCGWWGWRRCSRSREVYFTATAISSCVWGDWIGGKCFCTGRGRGKKAWTRTCTGTKCNRTTPTLHLGCGTCEINGFPGSWGGFQVGVCTNCTSPVTT